MKSLLLGKKQLFFLRIVNYAVLHGWQGLPEDLPSDLDIVLAPKDLARLEQALLSAKDAKLVNLLEHESTCYYFVLALQDGSQVRFLAVDVALDYRRDGRVWFSAEELLLGRRKWKDFWVASPEVEFKYLLVKKILKQEIPAHAGKRLRELAGELGQKAEEEACRLLGNTWGSRVVEWLRKGDMDAFESHLPTLKKVLKRERLRQDPLNPLRYWIPELKRIWQRWHYPTGLWVAVLGPDGAGKSTLIKGLQKELFGAFRRTATFNLMPRLLRRGGDGCPVTDPHGKPPRSLPASLLKLAYYWLDYTLGYWLKVRPALVRSTFVLFDRYYDDLLVDPKRYRYGGPLWLARWLRTLISRPHVFLVLDVPVDKLLERKQEVPREELERQIEDYRRFAVSTPNAFLLDGGQPADEVIRQGRDVLLDFLHERYLRRRRIWFREAEGDDLAWVAKALGVEVDSGLTAHAYLRLPDGRGFLLPLDNAHLFHRGLEIYPAQSWKGRLARTFLASLAGAGIKGAGLRKVRLEAKAGSVFRKLQEAFGREDLCFAVSLGTPGPHRKPVVQVLTPDGEVLGYAKVGWNEATRELVKHETEVLQNLSREKLPFGVPRLLYANDDGHRSLCVQGPPPGEAHPAPGHLGEAYLGVVQTLAARGVCWEPLEETAFWQRIVARSRDAKKAYYRQMLAKAMEEVKCRWAGKKVPLHFAHGDFAPWNASMTPEGLYLYDWEYAQESAPAGYDLFHFLSQMGWLVEGRKPVELLMKVLERSHEESFHRYWKQVGVSRSEIAPLIYLYFLDKESLPYDRVLRGILGVMIHILKRGEKPDAKFF